jgi:hypothetical protein
MGSIFQSSHLTRRELLQAAAAGTLGWTLGQAWAADPPFKPPSHLNPDPSNDPASQSAKQVRPWWLGPEYKRSRVVQVRADNVLNGSVPDPYVLDDILGQGVQAITDETSPERAWRKLLGDSQRIVLRFDLVASKLLNTTDAMARTLIGQISRAGYHPRTVALVGVPHYLERALGTRTLDRGWGPPVRVGERLEPIANYVYECDVLINVPFLMAHPVGGMSGAVLGLSYALLKHPGRYYKDEGQRLVLEVLRSPAINAKLQLNLMNALRVITENGPDASEDAIAPFGGLLFGFDPVALDGKGLDVLARERRRHGLDALMRLPYLSRAVALEIGRLQVNEVEHIILGPERGL